MHFVVREVRRGKLWTGKSLAHNSGPENYFLETLDEKAVVPENFGLETLGTTISVLENTGPENSATPELWTGKL